MASLWELDNAILECVDTETGEVLDIEKVEALNLEIDQKIENLCKWIKNLEADAEAYKQYKMAFADKQKAAENKAKSIKSYIQMYLDGKKWEASDKSVRVAYRTTKDKVTIDDITAIPAEWFKTPQTESNLNKTALKEAILEGHKIDGVHLEDSISMQIK